MNINYSEKQSIRLLKELVRINTTNEDATEFEAAFLLKEILDEANIDSEIIYSPNGRANLVAKLKANNPEENPLVLLSHLDVVSHGGKRWTHPPFSGKLADEMIWGRGTLDTKQLTIMHLISLLNLVESKTPLNRDVYFVATADEENGGKEGMEFLASSRPELFLNATVLSEGGGFTVKTNSENHYMLYAAGEKGTARIKLVGKGDSGHAGSPPANQAVFNLSLALQKIIQDNHHKAQYPILNRFEVVFKDELNDDKNKDEIYYKLFEYMREQTYSVDLLNVGDQINAIPYKGEVTLEFRTLPATTEEEFSEYMYKVLEGEQITWELVYFQQGYESEIESKVIQLFKKHSPDCGFSGQWVPFTALGRTDGRFISKLAKDIYGLSPVTIPFKDVLQRVHQVDERIEVDAFLYGVSLMKKVVYDYCIKS